MGSHLAELHARSIVLEISKYKNPPDGVVKVVCSVLCLLGLCPSSKAAWDELQSNITQDIFEKMLERDLISAPNLKGYRKKKQATMWQQSKLALKEINLEDVMENTSYAIRVMAGWVSAAHTLNDTASKIRKAELLRIKKRKEKEQEEKEHQEDES